MQVMRSTCAWFIRSLLATAALMASGHAAAQGQVSIGGIIDGSVVMVKTTGGWQKLVQSGDFYGSRLIISGSEDLGGGLKAHFHLEPGFFIDTGAANATFFRRSFVSLEGVVGRIDIGRDYNPLFSVLVRTDPLEGGLLASATGFQAAAGAQANNAIFYSTPKVGGFVAKFMASLGESTAGPLNNGNRQGAHMFWDIGALTAFAAWARDQTVVGNTGSTATDWQALVGARYRLAGGGWVTAMIQPGHNNSGSAAFNANNGVAYAKNFTTAMVGIRMPIPGTAFSVGATYQRYNDRTTANRNANALGMAVFYKLSPRSTLYANAGFVSNDSGQRFTLVDAGRTSYAYTPAAGQTINPRGLAMGLKHIF